MNPLPLAGVIGEERRRVEALGDLLRREQEILQAGGVDGIAELAGEKTVLIGEINRLGALRLQRLGLPADAGRPAIAAWFAAHPAEKTADAAWQALLASAGEIRRLHDENTQLVNLLLAQTQGALDALSGRQAAPGLYGADGQTASAAGSRLFDAA